MKLNFSRNQVAAEALERWWHFLDRERGLRAGLRRCHSPDEVAMQPGYHHLLRILGAGPETEQASLERLAVLAGVASHVRRATFECSTPEPGAESSRARTLASAMARPEGDKQVVSEARFRRLLEKDKPSELMLPLVRAIKLLDGAVNLPDLGESLVFWGEKVRKRWAYDYYMFSKD